MKTSGRKQKGFRPGKIAEFFEAAYNLEIDDQTWLSEVMAAGRAVYGREGPAHGLIYDASNISDFRVWNVHAIEFPEAGNPWLERGLDFFTPAYVARTYRSGLIASSGRQVSSPELLPFFEAMSSLGYRDLFAINGLDPGGVGTFFGLWTPERVEPPAGEMAIYRRMAHHLGAAHRCRRRLRESQPDRSAVDPTDGAEAILDARRRIVHAVGPAKERAARTKLIEASTARDLARTTAADASDGLRRWGPLTSTRWTLVDSFEKSGSRYIVARENQTRVPGLAALSNRERQAVAYLAIGQSTKETAYALGISDVTVRVLLARAAAKLGVRSRTGLLSHSEVRALTPFHAETSDRKVAAGKHESKVRGR